MSTQREDPGFPRNFSPANKTGLVLSSARSDLTPRLGLNACAAHGEGGDRIRAEGPARLLKGSELPACSSPATTHHPNAPSCLCLQRFEFMGTVGEGEAARVAQFSLELFSI